MVSSRTSSRSHSINYWLVSVVALALAGCGGSTEKKKPGTVEEPDGSTGNVGGSMARGGSGAGGMSSARGGSGAGGMTVGSGGMMVGAGGAGMAGMAAGGRPAMGGMMMMAMGGAAMGGRPVDGGGDMVRRDGSADMVRRDGSADTARPDATGDTMGVADAVALAPLTVTSTTFMNNGMLPNVNTCAGGDGSPPLAWTAGPASTKSYALVMTSSSGRDGWVIWDIPAATRMLPSGVNETAMPANVAGAKQTANGGTGKFGYSGPCPGGMEHTYTFVVYAVDVATLPGVTSATTENMVEAAIKANAVAVGQIAGKSAAVRPDAGADAP